MGDESAAPEWQGVCMAGLPDGWMDGLMDGGKERGS